MSVDYATADGSATAGSDYAAASGTLHWADGDIASKTFTVTLHGDPAGEPAETVNLTLSNPMGGAVLGTLITQARASINLFDLSAGGGISRLLDGVFILVGTLSTLLYFSFSAKAQRNAAPQRPVPAVSGWIDGSSQLA